MIVLLLRYNSIKSYNKSKPILTNDNTLRKLDSMYLQESLLVKINPEANFILVIFDLIKDNLFFSNTFI